MPGAEAAAAAGAQAGPAGGGGSGLLGTIFRMGLMWYVMQWFKGGQPPAKQNPADIIAPAFPKSEVYDMYVYMNEQPNWQAYPDDLIWHEPDVSWAMTDAKIHEMVYYPSPVRCAAPQSV